MYLSPQPWPSSNCVHFIHNWRCSGTSLNSVLSSNFPAHYFKLGQSFNPFGWPFSEHAKQGSIESLEDIYLKLKVLSTKPYIVGGHSFGLRVFFAR